MHVKLKPIQWYSFKLILRFFTNLEGKNDFWWSVQNKSSLVFTCILVILVYPCIYPCISICIRFCLFYSYYFFLDLFKSKTHKFPCLQNSSLVSSLLFFKTWFFSLALVISFILFLSCSCYIWYVNPSLI